jgi:circadian clock protein KaiC
MSESIQKGTRPAHDGKETAPVGNWAPKISTGIPGLDYILGGGFPENHLYLIEGQPGTGKTTMALQFLLEGRRRGETCLYVTLSETEDELRAVADSHGWSLEGLGLFELGSIEERLQPDEQYTVFHPAEIELGQTTQRICEEVDRIQPTRVVFDSLSEMRLLARDALRYRRQVLALKQFFTGRKCTVIFLDDRTAERTDLQLQSICHGVLILERLSVEYGGARRRLAVSKIRGLQFREGNHDFVIQPGGVVVYPRLVAAESRNGFPTDGGPRQKATSGIPELDSILGGGIHYGTSTLVMGPAGCGKSTVLTQYALASARAGQRVACYVFEETRENFLERAEGLGMNLRGEIEQGRIGVEQVNPAELSPGEFTQKVRTAIETGQIRIAIIDSLNGILNAMPNENFLLIQMHELLTYLNERGVLTLISLAQNGLLGNGVTSPIDVTYLADTVIVLRYFEAFGEVKQALAVIKKRTGGHEHSIREFNLTAKGIKIGEPLKDFAGVLTGNPVYTGRREDLIGESDA